MKKIIPILICFALAVCFAACGDDGETTTLNITQPVATTTAQEQVADATEDPNAVLLTTAFGETVPTVITTAFDIASEQQNASLVIPGDNLTVPDVTAPVVVTDFVPTTIPPSVTAATIPSDDGTSDNGGTEPSSTNEQGETESVSSGDGTSQTETQYSEENDSKNKRLYSAGSSNDDNGNIELLFDYDDWDRIKSQKATAKVTCNGKTRSLKGTINGVEDEGYFTYTIDISDLKPSNGDLVIITLSKGAVVSINGKQSSAEETVQHTYEE